MAKARMWVHVDPSSITKPYTIMGKGYINEGVGDNFIKHIQSLAVSEAKRKGADTILIQDYYIPAASTDVSTTLRTDSVGKGTVTVGNTTVQQNGSQKFAIVFLKYK
jgi:hypothetical protein